MSTFDHRQPTLRWREEWATHTSGGDDCPTPSTPIDSFTYDEDGNLRLDDQYEYVWDAENRLIEITTRIDLGGYFGGYDEGDKRLRFVYDYMGRRSEKTHEVHTSGNWVMQSGYPKWFIYDGWNVQLVLKPGSTYDPVTNPTDIVTERKYTWGLDLSGSFHGAGSIGGLLATVEAQGTSQTGDDVSYWYFYDANGNVGQLINGTTPGTPVLAAQYEYDPYGNLLAAVDVDTSNYVNINPFRFSTKWLDYEIGGTALGTTITGAVGADGLYYYGYRYYSPRLGRWVKRDPIEEEGGVNLYGFVANEPTNSYDPLGLWKPWDHRTLTEESYNRSYVRSIKPCKTLLDRLTKANTDQDKGAAYQDKRRHYSRRIDRTNRNVSEADQAYADYVDEELREFHRILDTRAALLVSDCQEAADTLGRVTHSWQDYFAHTVLWSGAAGPAWSATPPIQGTPERRNVGVLKPCSWNWELAPGEHGWTEPAYRDGDGSGRKQDAIWFVTKKYRELLEKWGRLCGCYCEGTDI